MKKFLMEMTLCLALTFGAGVLWAHEDGKNPDRSLTGEVVCLSCYLGHGGEGEVHAKCAKQCFGKGLPVGLKVGEQLYLLVGEKHGTANKMMASYAGKQVTVSGHVSQQEGMSMMTVESVKKAGEAAAKDSKTKQAKVIYTCSMDPDVTSDKPGKCPKCGMDLIEKK